MDLLKENNKKNIKKLKLAGCLVHMSAAFRWRKHCQNLRLVRYLILSLSTPQGRDELMLFYYNHLSITNY